MTDHHPPHDQLTLTDVKAALTPQTKVPLHRSKIENYRLVAVLLFVHADGHRICELSRQPDGKIIIEIELERGIRSKLIDAAVFEQLRRDQIIERTPSAPQNTFSLSKLGKQRVEERWFADDTAYLNLGDRGNVLYYWL